MDKSDVQKSLQEARNNIEHGDCRKAYEILKPLLSEQNQDALFIYASFSISNIETEEEFDERRIKILQELAGAGYAPAIYELAVCYDTGDFIEQDSVRAATLYKSAAETGYAKAKLSHGLNLYYGSNQMPEKKEMGLSLIKQAADENVEGAYDALQQLK